MAEHDEQLTLASQLCLACGLCCDGTIYAFATIREDEVDQTDAIGLKTMRTSNGSPAFVIQCHYLAGKACMRYDQWRPSVCGDYFCEVQRKVRKQKLSSDAAFALIAQAQKLKAEVEALLPDGVPILEARNLFKQHADNASNLAADAGKFIVRMFVMERFLDQHFRAEGAGHLPQPVDSAEAKTQTGEAL